ncbi:AsnC family protein [Ectobacillus funiculus]|uniref:AsnC family protein n=1 Tax=Ectobacillus funiculus TaxID=137993 RepID=A0ABV5WAE1_9BACI
MSSNATARILAPQAHTIIENWHEFYASETKKAGYIATLKPMNGTQRFWGLNDIPDMLKYAARNKKEDMYLSLNAFEYGSREAGKLKQIRNLGVDIDCHSLSITPHEALEKLQSYILIGHIPNPNLVIFSGRGLQILFSIANGAAPQVAYLAQYITVQYISKLKDIGADPRACDLPRVLRFPGTTNTKNNAAVKVEIWRQLEYSLQELYEFCTPLEQARKRGKQRKGNVAVFIDKVGAKTLYSLNAARVNDLQRLVEIRNGDLTGCRNTFIYIYSFTVCLFLKSRGDTEDFIQPTIGQIYSTTDKQMKKSEINATIKSACNDATEFMESFSANEFSMRGLSRTLIKPMKNDTVIDKLHITEAEMKAMRTIIGATVKRERNTESTRNKRREAGMRPMAEYNAERKEQAENMLWQLQQAIERHPGKKQKEYAEMLGVTPMRISQLTKKLKK